MVGGGGGGGGGGGEESIKRPSKGSSVLYETQVTSSPHLLSDCSLGPEASSRLFEDFPDVPRLSSPF